MNIPSPEGEGMFMNGMRSARAEIFLRAFLLERHVGSRTPALSRCHDSDGWGSWKARGLTGDGIWIPGCIDSGW
jgi:hypothetical protein